MDNFRDKLSEPVLTVIRENPGLTYTQIIKKLDWPITLNGLKQNQIYHLKTTGQIENRAKKGQRPRWYIKEN